MDNSQIWLKPKPTHIDEYFEDFLNYLKSSGSSTDALHTESIRLLKERVTLLVQERTSTPVYRQAKDIETLKFNARLCGAWLLAITDASKQERKQVLLTMVNNLVYLSLQSNITALNNCTFAYKSVPDLLEMAMRVATYEMPEVMSFTWNDLVKFSLDLFIVSFLKMRNLTASDSCYEGKGMMTTKNGGIQISSYSKQVLEKKFLNANSETCILPEYGFTVSTDKNVLIKESQKDDIEVIADFVNEIMRYMKSTKKDNKVKRLLHYSDGDYVPVEVTEVSSQRIILKTIDPSYIEISGQLIFDQNLKIFSKVYPAEVWAKVLKTGDRFNVNVNTSYNTFSITNLFIDYINDNVAIDDVFDAHNRKVTGGWLKLREFWTDAGFMVFVDLSEEEDEELDGTNGNAGIEITGFGTGQFKGCLYGHVYDYEVEKLDISRDEVCPMMLSKFIAEHSQIKLMERGEKYEEILPKFIKEYSTTLNILQSREVNPMLRYRILSVMRMLCTLIEDEKDDKYCQYIAQYLKTLILFAKAESNEGKTIISIEAPEDLKDEETVTNGADILKILSCFAKDYDATSDILDPYIEDENKTLSQIASLVQSYNRLIGLLEGKTLRGIKKQILNQLSVVTDGDSTLELSGEFEGIFGEEDDMKEFKTSFFEAPGNAKEQRQFHNIFRGVCAMMNNRGGVLYLGVNDKGVPVGLKNDLDNLSKKFNLSPSLDAYMLHISKQGEEWFGETYWKYVTLKPISEHNVVSIVVEPYPYDIVYLKDGTTYLRKNNASAPITDESTIEDIRRRRMENLRKTDDKTIVLRDAIQKERKVRFMGYRSSSSGTIQNRVLEAFQIDSNEYIHCYEAESDMVKMFRISRADRIVMLDDPWQYKRKHKPLSIDPFHMSGATKTTVKLRLKLQAKNAIEEYYPGISQHIKQYNSDTWTLDTFTYNLYPLMVFYLSHAKYVEIVDVKGLKEAVMEYVNQNLHI